MCVCRGACVCVCVYVGVPLCVCVCVGVSSAFSQAGQGTGCTCTCSNSGQHHPHLHRGSVHFVPGRRSPSLSASLRGFRLETQTFSPVCVLFRELHCKPWALSSLPSNAGARSPESAFVSVSWCPGASLRVSALCVSCLAMAESVDWRAARG